MAKQENIKEYKEFCERNRLVEDESTVSFFCMIYRNKGTRTDDIRINQLYKYVSEQK